MNNPAASSGVSGAYVRKEQAVYLRVFFDILGPAPSHGPLLYFHRHGVPR